VNVQSDIVFGAPKTVVTALPGLRVSGGYVSRSSSNQRGWPVRDAAVNAEVITEMYVSNEQTGAIITAPQLNVLSSTGTGACRRVSDYDSV